MYVDPNKIIKYFPFFSRQGQAYQGQYLSHVPRDGTVGRPADLSVCPCLYYQNDIPPPTPLKLV